MNQAHAHTGLAYHHFLVLLGDEKLTVALRWVRLWRIRAGGPIKSATSSSSLPLPVATAAAPSSSSSSASATAKGRAAIGVSIDTDRPRCDRPWLLLLPILPVVLRRTKVYKAGNGSSWWWW